MNRTSRWVSALVLVGAFSLTAAGTSSALGVPTGAEKWEVVSLNPDGHGQGMVAGSEDLSHVVATTVATEKDWATRVFKDGKLIREANIPEEVFRDVNNSGVILGYGPPQELRAMTFTGQDKGVPLASPEGAPDCIGSSINDASESIGYCYKGQIAMPVYWATPQSEPVVLDVPEAHQLVTVNPLCIDNDGNMAGVVYKGNTSKTVVWNSDGTIRATLESPTPEDSVHLTNLVHGKVFGWIKHAGQRDDRREAAASSAEGSPVWDAQTGKISYLKTEGFGRLAAVNSNGVFGGADSGLEPRLWKDGKMTAELPAFNGEPHQQGWAEMVSDDGRTVVGTSGEHAVIWQLK